MMTRLLHQRLFFFVSRFQILHSRYKLYGPVWVLTRVFKRLFYFAAWIVLLPITIILHLAGFRRVLIFTDRIGHLAAEVNGFLMERELGLLPSHHWFILDQPKRVANACLMDYWRAHISIIRQPLLVRILDIMTSRWLMRHDVERMILTEGTSVLYALHARWADRAPFIKLTDEHRARGYSLLESLGLPSGAWFVCVHVREPGFSAVDEMHMDFRNATPANTSLAINEVVARGGWCIRMGDASGVPLPPMPGVIDYPRSGAKSDWMDVFLCAECRVFFGANSGLYFLSTVFGKPVALANIVPPSILAPRPGDLSIPKLMRRSSETQPMSFNEVMASPAANYQHSTAYKAAQLVLIENEAEDIQALMVEMLDVLEGREIYSEEDKKLQAAYLKLFREGHFSFGAASRIGRQFLRKHRGLLGFPSSSKASA